jgi:hypothetical protein
VRCRGGKGGLQPPGKATATNPRLMPGRASLPFVAARRYPAAMSVAARSFAALTALVAPFALGALFVVTSGQQVPPNAGAALWRMAGYFTVLTNAMLPGHFAAVAVGWRIPPARIGGPVLWIGMTGIIYHMLLSGLWSPQGLAWWADQGLHSATPLLTVLWWLAFAPPDRPELARVAGWLLWPLAYCGCAVARGVATGFRPYRFLDPGLHGAIGVMPNITGLMAAFAALGALTAGTDRRRFSR